jgi:hypothetical protein
MIFLNFSVGYFYSLIVVGALVGSGEGVVEQPIIVPMHFFFHVHHLQPPFSQIQMLHSPECLCACGSIFIFAALMC